MGLLALVHRGWPAGRRADRHRHRRHRRALASLSFLSFVYPKGRWSFAFSRHQLANFKASSATDGLFASFFDGPTLRADDLRTVSDLKIVTWAATAALRISESLSLGLGVNCLSLGLGVNYHHGRLEESTELYTFPPGGLFLPNPYRPQDLIGIQHAMIDDRTWTISGGILWRINRHWSLGSVYRPGPAILIEQVLLAGPAFIEPEATVLDSDAFDVKLPDVYGLGLAFRGPNEALTVSVEWNHVEYSDILDSLEAGAGGTAGLVQDDGEELRLGLEYVFLHSKPLVAIRFGAWRDPDHRFRFEGQNIIDRAVLRAGDDELHLAAGLGLAFDRYQIDLGVDFSDEVNALSLSAIYTF